MLFANILLPVATLLSVVVAAVPTADLAQILLSLPPCVSQCSLQGMTEANCQLADISNCLCRNITMQSQLAECVQSSCAPKDQAIGSAVQARVCEGIPQESRSEEVLQTMIVLTVITFTVVGLRVLSRYAVTRQMWWDDLAALLAAFFATALSVDLIMNAKNGFGKHYWNIDFTKAPLLLKLFYASQLLYIAVQITAKASILLFYLRVFPRPPFQLATKLTLAWVIIHGLIFLLVDAFQCTPVATIWDLSVVKKNCINTQAFIYAGAAASILEDFVIVVLPISELKTLQLGRKKKIGLGFMFGIGSFACVTSIVRLKFIVSFGNSLDSTWENVDVVKWSAIEVYTAIICACLPSIRPLLVKYLPSIFSSGTSHGKSEPKSHDSAWRPSHLHGSGCIGINSIRGKGIFNGSRNTNDSGAQMLSGSRGSQDFSLGGKKVSALQLKNKRSGKSKEGSIVKTTEMNVRDDRIPLDTEEGQAESESECEAEKVRNKCGRRE